MTIPSQVWALIPAGLAVILCLAIIFHPAPEVVVTAVIAIAASLVSVTGVALAAISIINKA